MKNWEAFIRRRAKNFKPVQPKEQHLINEKIFSIVKKKASNNVLLIGDGGKQYGEVDFNEALDMADEQGLDLVLVGPNPDVPVCKIMDYGKIQYDKMKKLKKSKAKNVDVKSLKFGVSIEKHDFDVKINNIRKFLSQGKKVKLKVFLRGREIVYPDLGKKLMEDVFAAVEDIAVLDERIKVQDRNVTMSLSPSSDIENKK